MRNGRYPFTLTLKTAWVYKDLKSVHQNELDYPDQTPSRSRECASGQVVTWHSCRTDFGNWKLKWDLCCCMSKLGPFSVNRMNAEFLLYCSWKSSRAAVTVDALSVLWKRHHQYMFTSFVLIVHYLSNLQDQVPVHGQGYCTCMSYATLSVYLDLHLDWPNSNLLWHQMQRYT